MHPLLKTKGFKPRTGTVEVCLFCNAEFYLSPSRAKRFKKKFCSQRHMIDHMKANAFRFSCSVCNKVVFVQPVQRWVYNRNMDKKKIDYIITCAKHGEERTSKRCEPWVRFGYKSKEEYEEKRKQAIPLW